MAHLEKFKKSGLGQILAHVRRGTSEEIVDRQYSNENIDSDKSIFNQNLPYSLHLSYLRHYTVHIVA